ncbi:MAG TPA: acetoacetate decarboxylase family protein [Sandaracinaceae bacterium]
MSPRAYPPPPWRTFGWALFVPYRVRAADVRAPDGFEIEAVLGWTIGLLGIVDYGPPSLLEYRELVWMPARARARRADGKIARGWLVAKMLVDSEASLAAGREVWALPKQRGRFTIDHRGALVEAEDGATVELTFGWRWPGAPAQSAIVTLQPRGSELVRFRGDMSALAAPRGVRVRARGLDESWASLASARALGRAGLELRDFCTIMQPPVVLPR